jgi:molybdopterin adenylyltransferase
LGINERVDTGKSIRVNNYSVGILTISDRSSQGLREDLTSPVLRKMILDLQWQVAKMQVISDDLEPIKQTLIEWVDCLKLDLILTTGGTGFSPRDNTPEATLDVIEREARGLTEAMRYYGISKTPHAMLSRAVAGIRKRTLIINLPGNPQAARENLGVVLTALPHALALLSGDPDSEMGHILDSGK